jgi:hypothetical protein
MFSLAPSAKNALELTSLNAGRDMADTQEERQKRDEQIREVRGLVFGSFSC